VTELVNKYVDENLLEVFVAYRSDIFLDFYKEFEKFEKEYPYEFYMCLKKLNKNYYNYKHNNLSDNKFCGFRNFLKYKSKDKDYKS